MSTYRGVDRLRQSSLAQRDAWAVQMGDAVEAPADIGPVVERIVVEDDEGRVLERVPVAEVIDLIEQAKREAVCPVCGRRQDGIEIVEP